MYIGLTLLLLGNITVILGAFTPHGLNAGERITVILIGIITILFSLPLVLCS